MAINKEIKLAKLILVDCRASGIIFSVNKTLAKTIAKKAESSENFRFSMDGLTLILSV